MVKSVYDPDTGRLHGFVICDLSDVMCRIADQIVRCGRLFGKPWEPRKRASLQCRADQRMGQQTGHAGFALLSLRPFQETEIYHADCRNDVSFFFARQERAERNDTHAKNGLSKEPQSAARNFSQRCRDTKQTTRRREHATKTDYANNADGQPGRTVDMN